MSNPTRLTWRHDGKNTDGSDFTAEQFAGFVIDVNGGEALAVPAEWTTDGQYEMLLADMPVFRETGNYIVSMATVARNGQTSAWSEPVAFALDFRQPTAPTDLAVGSSVG